MAIQISKSEKISRRRSSSYLQAWFMVNRFFGCGEECYHFQQELLVSKAILKLFSYPYQLFYYGIIINSMHLASMRAT